MIRKREEKDKDTKALPSLSDDRQARQKVSRLTRMREHLENQINIIALIENLWVISKAQQNLVWKHPKLSRRLKEQKFLKMIDEPRVKKVLEKKGYSLERIKKNGTV